MWKSAAFLFWDTWRHHTETLGQVFQMFLIIYGLTLLTKCTETFQMWVSVAVGVRTCVWCIWTSWGCRCSGCSKPGRTDERRTPAPSPRSCRDTRDGNWMKRFIIWLKCQTSTSHSAVFYIYSLSSWHYVSIVIKTLNSILICPLGDQ